MTAEEFREQREKEIMFSLSFPGQIDKLMVEFAKMHLLKVKHLQQSKYYAGETGYIKSEEWDEIFNEVI